MTDHPSTERLRELSERLAALEKWLCNCLAPPMASGECRQHANDVLALRNSIGPLLERVEKLEAFVKKYDIWTAADDAERAHVRTPDEDGCDHVLAELGEDTILAWRHREAARSALGPIGGGG